MKSFTHECSHRATIMVNHNGTRLEPRLPPVRCCAPAEQCITREVISVEWSDGIPNIARARCVRSPRDPGSAGAQTAQPERILAEMHAPLEPLCIVAELDRTANQMMSNIVRVNQSLEPILHRTTIRIGED